MALGLAVIAAVIIVPPARGALPPQFGGELALPAPEPVTTLDPARARTHFEATLASAVFDGLYEVRPSGAIEPVLADGPPIVEGTTATIRLRPGLLHHAGRPLTARHVVRSLLRVSSVPEASWLLGAIATDGGRLAIREVDDRTLTIELARPGVHLTRILAATPLAIVAGGNLARRPVGTGPFHARLDGRGGIELNIFRRAPDAPPWLNRVRFAAPVPRDEEIRAFELGRIDGSWWGRSLYGGEPVRPAATATAPATATILLVPNRARALRASALWGGVVALVDRRRLERVGLRASATLGPALPAPSLPSAAPVPRGTQLRMLVRAAHPLEVRLAEALAGILDEHGVHLDVERVESARYDAAVARANWDLRLALVRPPLPGDGALVASALAAGGQLDRARRIALDDTAAVTAAARDLGAMVLGHERVVLHHRADVIGLTLDASGRVPLADLSFARVQGSGAE